MNTVWSKHVQGINTLYLSRKLRFDARFSEQYRSLFRLDPHRQYRILEIGCGPGALAGVLHRWYPCAEITALDRDSAFLDFARSHEPGITFLEGDATCLPFEAQSFDVTVSYTLQEHVEPAAFWGEQHRVLKPGGVCLCLSARKGIRQLAPCLETTEAERIFWAEQPDAEQEFETWQVCRFPCSEAQLPAAMEAHGFRNVSTGYVVSDLTPDDPKYSAPMAEAMIEAERQNDLEAVRSTDSPRAEQICGLVNAKYDERLRLYRAGIKQWDTAVSLAMILRGER
ncbi:MAG: class I SAM-dependent methyltransferase [Oscillospiraceae bacterium]|nr:class I SAM-dependent methyltransferase [Oscillospiraceae bacterium]